MGLDFSHCEARWGYIGFMQFRTKLAAEAGIALRCMDGFNYNSSLSQQYEHLSIYGSEAKPSDGSLMYGHYVGNQPAIPWSKINDPIKYLLNHSDCEGELTPDECRKVAPRLRELVAGWPDGDRDKENALELADGMDAAAAAGESLRFC